MPQCCAIGFRNRLRRPGKGNGGNVHLQRLKLPPSMYECLATTSLIESPESGVARRTANVRYRRDQGMVKRWVASAWVLTENRFRKISGRCDLWALATILGRKTETEISQEEVA